MKLRDPVQSPWVCEVSETFEAAYWRRLDSIDPCGFEELLQNFQEMAELNPNDKALAKAMHKRIGAALRNLRERGLTVSQEPTKGGLLLWSLAR